MTKKIIKEKFDYEMAAALAGIFCTKEEIADILEIDPEVLGTDDQFLKIYRKSIAEAKTRIRKKELELIDEDNTTIITLFGKVYLGQNEKSETKDKELEYDLKKLPDFYLNRIIKGEDFVKVINEYESA